MLALALPLASTLDMAPCSALLLLLATCCWLLPGAARGGDATAAADAQQVPPHHPGGHLPTASLWTPPQVETWLFAEGFGFLRERFDAAQVNGRVLLAMRDHTLQVDFELEPSACRLPSLHPPASHLLPHPPRAPPDTCRQRAITPAAAPIAQRSGTW